MRDGGNGANRPAKLVVERATKHYATRSGLVHALEDYSMSVAEGELVCVLGPSGCGKSTLLWAMAGLHGSPPGEVRLDGEPVIRPHPQIGMVFQDANLLPWRSLIKNIHLPFELKRLKAAAHRERIDGLLARRRPRRLRDQIPARALGRHAAARLDRALPLGRSVAAADGRAVRRARRLHPRRDEPAAPGDLARDAAKPSCSSPTTSPRRCSSPTGSW